jgi:DNA polymerase III epsilon subunit-like protein
MISILDIETTGLPEMKGFNKYYHYSDLKKYNSSRIVSICLYQYENSNLKNKFYYLLKPTDFEVKGEEWHQISHEQALKEGKEWRDLKDKLFLLLNSTTKLIGHNISFDKNVLLSEMYRQGFVEIVNLLEKIDVYCTMINGKNITKILVDGFCNYKYPRLNELYQYLFQEEMQNHHNAEQDVINTAKCYFKMILK